MEIKKRSIPMYIFLNCITLGVYGFIVCNQIGKEIDMLCQGDGEKPKLGFAATTMIRAIGPILGIIGTFIGTIFLTGSADVMSGWGYSSVFYGFDADLAKLLSSIMNIYLIGIAASTIASSFSNAIIFNVYYKYWWNKQATRLKVNASRYGIYISEKGSDVFIARSWIFELILIPFTIILMVIAMFVPTIIVSLITLGGANTVAAIFMFIFVIPICIFGGEMTAGANFSMIGIIKNLNRYADVYKNGANPFDPMGYEYYPCKENFVLGVETEAGNKVNGTEVPAPPPEDSPAIIGMVGTFSGYKFDLTPGEELVIGKDAKVSSIVVDQAFKDVSRKHVGVTFDTFRNQYRVVDYSSNGTWSGTIKLTKMEPVYLPRGSEIRLANGSNIFILR